MQNISEQNFTANLVISITEKNKNWDFADRHMSESRNGIRLHSLSQRHTLGGASKGLNSKYTLFAILKISLYLYFIDFKFKILLL